jgi:hypothetical protein
MEEQVRKVLKKGPKTNRELREDLGLDTKSYDQKLDRTLQKLRKEGKLVILQGRWSLASIEACPTCHGRGWIDKGKDDKMK